MKKLIWLIPTAGKTPEQITKEVWEAYERYKQVSDQEEKLEQLASKQT